METRKVDSEEISHPQHYNAGKIEVIEFIEDQQFNFHRGNACKYLSRAGRKNADKEIEDLQKCIWYIKREIETLKATQESREPMRPNDMNPRSISATDVLNSKQLGLPTGFVRTAQTMLFTTGYWIEVSGVENVAVMAYVPSMTGDISHLLGKIGCALFTPNEQCTG